VRGESAYLLEAEDHYLAHVEEGWEPRISRLMRSGWPAGVVSIAKSASDTVATIVNDLITCGALPVSGRHARRCGRFQLVRRRSTGPTPGRGFCRRLPQAGAVWGGGETPTLRGIVEAPAIVLAGSAVGRIAPKNLRITGDVHDGDAIIFLASSGVQTNGLTLCRKIADQLPQGYQTPVETGRTYGEALLAPSVIYVAFVRGMPAARITAHSGHAAEGS